MIYYFILNDGTDIIEKKYIKEFYKNIVSELNKPENKGKILRFCLDHRGDNILEYLGHYTQEDADLHRKSGCRSWRLPYIGRDYTEVSYFCKERQGTQFNGIWSEYNSETSYFSNTRVLNSLNYGSLLTREGRIEANKTFGSTLLSERRLFLNFNQYD